jgi:hypothetical protein
VVFEPHRVRQGVEGESDLLGSLDAEEVDLRAQRQDEEVVVLVFELAETHLPRVEVDLGDGVLVHPDIGVLVEEVAEGMPDSRLLE